MNKIKLTVKLLTVVALPFLLASCEELKQFFSDNSRNAGYGSSYSKPNKPVSQKQQYHPVSDTSTSDATDDATQGATSQTSGTAATTVTSPVSTETKTSTGATEGPVVPSVAPTVDQ